jgi:hypothetical protein
MATRIKGTLIEEETGEVYPEQSAYNRHAELGREVAFAVFVVPQKKRP